MTTDRPPNTLLARAMQEAAMSNTGLAARVRDLAQRDGHPISADHVSVRRWLDGMIPRERTCRYIALAIGSKLGRSVSPSEVGLSTVPHARTDLDRDGASYPGDASRAVDLLGDLSEADLNDSSAAEQLLWSPLTAASTITGHLFGQRSGMSVPSRRAESVLPADAIRATAAHLMDLDFAFGGGHVRRMLLSYFRMEVIPLLRASHHDVIRREVFSAAAEVIQLLGWSAYDAGRHGPAQRYFVQGLRLAREAEDHMLGGRLLANLSHQANFLGHHLDAAHLARAAQSATSGKASATVTAMFLAMEARALASVGQGQACAHVLGMAERVFGGRDPSADPPWIRYFDSEELAGEAAHCFRDLGDPMQTSTFAALAVGATNTPPRTRAFIGMVEAAGVLRSGALDQAVDLALKAVQLAGPIQSHRYTRYLTDFYRSLAENYKRDQRPAAFVEAVSRHYPELILSADRAR